MLPLPSTSAQKKYIERFGSKLSHSANVTILGLVRRGHVGDDAVHENGRDVIVFVDLLDVALIASLYRFVHATITELSNT